jgi:hypothetical protein
VTQLVGRTPGPQPAPWPAFQGVLGMSSSLEVKVFYST